MPETFRNLRWIRLLAFAFVALSALLGTWPTPARAQLGDLYGLSPFWNWKTIETEHFRIHFPAELADTAQRAANDLEEANTVYSKQLYWQPSYKVPILLIDNADSANGVTAAVLRIGIVLYATPPDDWFSTAYYDDWLRLLCFHEYTHFMNMDATRGFWATGRYLFGDVLLPNSIWPTWMLEGLAVYDETLHTHAGRGRSPYYEMILRAAVNDHVLDTSQFYTLDRVNGTGVPYYPGGEAPYLFGYELMNEVARSNGPGPTADGKGELSSGTDALGVMSYRSSWRFPWFINGNLENITGRSWYDYWDKFIQETRDRASQQLATIGSQPLSAVHPLTTDGYDVLGSTFSPDGRWVAFTGETLNERSGLYLRDLKTGETRRVANKISGAQMAFTPDSKSVLLSSLRREAEYYEYSELGVYSIEKGSMDWLTSMRRARDPDLSRDGKLAVFTVASGAKVSLAEAPVTERDGKLELGDIREIVVVNPYDAISSPKLSPDGRTVYFSFHKNGRASEELMALDRETKRLRVLVADGHFNRYPAIDSRGNVYFVSDRTGVDNIYRYRPGKAPELYTNLPTGAAFPSISTNDTLYGAAFSYTGWNLAQFDPLPRAVNPQSVTIAPPPAPVSDADSTPKPEARKYPVDDYSVFPSIWPRAWIPYAYVAPSNLSFGEAIAGFDAVDRHRYLLNVGYDTLSSALDWTAEYQNRSFGPTLTFVASNQFSYATYLGSAVDYYTRDQIFSIGASFQKLWTFASLTPSLALTFDRTSYYYPSENGPAVQTSYLPVFDAVLSYSNLEQSRLAIAPEHGRSFALGSRYYINNENETSAAKGLLSDIEFFRLGDTHAVLAPSLNASYTSATPATNVNLNSDVIVQGYYPLVAADPILGGINGFPSPSLGRLPIRGYPYAAYYEKAAVIPALDLRFPLFNVFRGWGTNPLFLDQIYGTAFAEAAYFPYHESALLPFLPSAGGGVTTNLELLVQVPVSVSVQYQYGFQKQAYGTGDMIVDVGYSGPVF